MQFTTNLFKQQKEKNWGAPYGELKKHVINRECLSLSKQDQYEEVIDLLTKEPIIWGQRKNSIIVNYFKLQCKKIIEEKIVETVKFDLKIKRDIETREAKKALVNGGDNWTN